jgi:hypothetical protein
VAHPRRGCCAFSHPLIGVSSLDESLGSFKLPSQTQPDAELPFNSRSQQIGLRGTNIMKLHSRQQTALRSVSAGRAQSSLEVSAVMQDLPELHAFQHV